MLHPDTLPLARAFAEAGVEPWLIGGQAIELLCGGHVRDHDDIDFLIRAADGPQAVAVLTRLGFKHAHGSLQDGDVFYRRDDLLVDLVPMLENPPRCLGKLAALSWPPDFLTPQVVEMRGHPVQTLTPAMHREMKRVVAAFYGVELREKDRLDLAALDLAALDALE